MFPVVYFYDWISWSYSSSSASVWSSLGQEVVGGLYLPAAHRSFPVKAVRKLVRVEVCPPGISAPCTGALASPIRQLEAMLFKTQWPPELEVNLT